MNIKEIERLIERYYEGETTLEEEQLLHEYFRRDDVAPGLEQHKKLFGFFREEKGVEISNPDFDKILNEKLDKTGIITMPRRNSIYTAIAVAASILILIGLIFNFRQDLTKTKVTEQAALQQSDTAVAFAEARRTLMFVSARFNTGIESISHLEAFDRGLEQMNKLSTFYKYESLIINPDELENPSKNSN